MVILRQPFKIGDQLGWVKGGGYPSTGARRRPALPSGVEHRPGTDSTRPSRRLSSSTVSVRGGTATEPLCLHLLASGAQLPGQRSRSRDTWLTGRLSSVMPNSFRFELRRDCPTGSFHGTPPCLQSRGGGGVHFIGATPVRPNSIATRNNNPRTCSRRHSINPEALTGLCRPISLAGPASAGRVVLGCDRGDCPHWELYANW